MTIPYKTGTVSVTAGNPVVTGSGTAWSAALIIGGTFGLASGISLPIQSVDSDTQITLAYPWPGATASGQTYWIVRDTAYGQQTVANANALATIIAELRSNPVAALAGLTLAADKLPYATGAATMALTDLTSYARSTLLNKSDKATLLSALGVSEAVPKNAPVVTDLNSVTQSGWVSCYGGSNIPPGSTGWIVQTTFWSNGNYAVQVARSAYETDVVVMSRNRNENGTWTAWHPSGSATIGTVSQSGGIPTGSIIERGSNANGQYTKFADGTAIFTATHTLTASFTGDNGRRSLSFYSLVVFPMAFSSPPLINGSARDLTSGEPLAVVPDPSGQTNVSTTFYLVAWANLGSSSNISFRMTGIGRWF